MVTQEEARSIIQRLLESQRLAVLATQSETGPYTSLVSFAAAEDLAYLVFPTMRSTRKFNYLVAHPRVALSIDDRCTHIAELGRTASLTATGTARDLTDVSALTAAREKFLAKHPELTSFVNQPDCALVKVVVDTFHLVTDFQVLTEFRMPGFRRVV